MTAPEPFHGGRVVLYPGDCLEVLDTLEENSLDACVCDPPYHLASIVKRFGKNGSAPAKSNGATGVYARASAGFMGKEWDGGDIAFRPETWAKVLRVLKPGGHLLAFAAPKNVHWLAGAIEMAGFEMRDRLVEFVAADPAVARFMESLSTEQAEAFLRCLDDATFGGELFWVFGSGFPKSLDIAKAIDKRRDDQKEILRVTRFLATALDRAGKTRADVDAFMGTSDMAGWWTSSLLHRCQCPSNDQWSRLKAFLDFGSEMDAEVARLNSRKGTVGEAWQSARVLGRRKNGIGDDHCGEPGSYGFGREFDIKAPSSDAAAEWQGWGTALKPAYEPIVMARKPIEGSNAEKVLKHGTAAINVDGCKVGDEAWSKRGSNAVGGVYGDYTNDRPRSSIGRHPANVLHDGSASVVSVFPAVKSGGPGSKGASGADRRGNQGAASGAESRPAGTPMVSYTDAGSAARFFYCAKADADDRVGSKHPTVKPIDLMRYLIRLVTPPGGTVLDPFAGTGSTGAAAFLEGFNTVLIEREADYCADIRRRMELLFAGPATRKREALKARDRAQGHEDLPIFGGTQPEAQEGGAGRSTERSQGTRPHDRAGRTEKVT